eukprot:TRINITY_DN4301_c0_g1_i1.p1 TRINITY_DN4301_c0_g1~~TRINITY_DN4301_c0_g1_i1.p1  ORF type:complete len:305 (+),score=68.61 TRINITY_DN4301_c0_g1_i1:56-970(+)
MASAEPEAEASEVEAAGPPGKTAPESCVAPGFVLASSTLTRVSSQASDAGSCNPTEASDVGNCNPRRSSTTKEASDVGNCNPRRSSTTKVSARLVRKVTFDEQEVPVPSSFSMITSTSESGGTGEDNGEEGTRPRITTFERMYDNLGSVVRRFSSFASEKAPVSDMEEKLASASQVLPEGQSGDTSAVACQCDIGSDSVASQSQPRDGDFGLDVAGLDIPLPSQPSGGTGGQHDAQANAAGDSTLGAVWSLVIGEAGGMLCCQNKRTVPTDQRHEAATPVAASLADGDAGGCDGVGRSGPPPPP